MGSLSVIEDMVRSISDPKVKVMLIAVLETMAATDARIEGLEAAMKAMAETLNRVASGGRGASNSPFSIG